MSIFYCNLKFHWNWMFHRNSAVIFVNFKQNPDRIPLEMRQISCQLICWTFPQSTCKTAGEPEASRIHGACSPHILPCSCKHQRYIYKAASDPHQGCSWAHFSCLNAPNPEGCCWCFFLVTIYMKRFLKPQLVCGT